MRKIIHHIKKHGKTVHKHVRKHHKKYIFGAISAALAYKMISVMSAAIIANSMSYSFATGSTGIVDSGTIDSGIVLTGIFFINDGDTNTTGENVILNNNITGATHMRFGNTESNMTISAWDTFGQTKNWIIDSISTGTKTVYAQFSGNGQIISLQDTIEYLPIIDSGSIITGDTLSGTTLETGDILSGTILDTIPNIIIFNNITGASLNTEYISNTVDIEGINTGINISISNGLYSIDSGSWQTGNQVVYSGDSIKLKNTSSNNYSTNVSTDISLGTGNISWIISTASSNGNCDSGDINILNPISNDIYTGSFDINRSYNNSDCQSEDFVIKLRDSNMQYITIGTADRNDTTFNFDSTLLFSGYYNITGLNLSGDLVTIYTGQYSGNNSRFFSGHKIVVLKSNQDILYEGDYFTIDNLNPSISNIDLDIHNASGGYVGLGETIDISFDSSEELTGVLVNILGEYANLESVSGNSYNYTLDLSNNNSEGEIIYNIEFYDLAGNSGYIEGSDSVIFDKTNPDIDYLNFSTDGSSIEFDLDTDEETKINLAYILSGANTGTNIVSDSYEDTHYYFIDDIVEGEIYNYTLSIEDILENTTYIGGYFQLTGDDVFYEENSINSGDMIVDLGFEDEDENEDEENNSINTFLSEIQKFNNCKESIGSLSNVEIPVRSNTAILKMPNMNKSYVKKLVSAFSIVLFQRIEESGLNTDEIEEITKDFNNFLIILKLVRDNENECEQNLSNYYMSNFRDSLIEYNLTTE